MDSGTGAVRVAAVRALGGLRAGVPTLTVLWAVLRVDTLVVHMIKHQAVSAAQLLGSGRELADDVLPAGGRMGEGGVSQRDAIGTNGLTLGTFEAINVWLGSVPLTLPGEGGSLLLPDAGSLGLVEYQWRGAVVEMRVAVHTVVVFVTNVGVFMVEESVGSVAPLI